MTKSVYLAGVLWAVLCSFIPPSLLLPLILLAHTGGILAQARRLFYLLFVLRVFYSFPDSKRSLYSVYIQSPFVAFTNYGMSQIFVRVIIRSNIAGLNSRGLVAVVTPPVPHPTSLSIFNFNFIQSGQTVSLIDTSTPKIQTKLS